MRVCLVCEGSYPYIAGGVSDWVQMLCSNLSDVEFVIWSIATTKEEMSELKYDLPENVKDVVTVYLGEEALQDHYRNIRISEREKKVLRRFVSEEGESVSWASILEFFKKNRKKAADIVMSKGFYEVCLEEYGKTAGTESFRQYLGSFREMYFSLLNPLSGEIPKADLYHTLSTGYAGVLASAASYVEKKPLILTEHGIYTREREEDIIRADWINSDFKELWIQFFKKLALITYNQASLVTSLFENNKALQVELGCPEAKIQIVPNGVAAEEYTDLENKHMLKEGGFHIGAPMRVAPEFDVKTLILAFEQVLEKVPNANLWIMGDYEKESAYYLECLNLLDVLKISNVIFLGEEERKNLFPEMNLLVLSGINEEQSLTMLGGMAAGKPFVCTNVGDCMGLLEGKVGDTFGRAGYVVPVMDSKTLADTIIQCANEPETLQAMGEAAMKRVSTYYRREDFLNRYKSIYDLYGGNK